MKHVINIENNRNNYIMKLLLKVFLATLMFLSVACEKQDNEKSGDDLDCLLYYLEWKNQVGTDYESSGSTTCTYNSNNIISELSYEYEGIFTQEIFSYDEYGRIATLTYAYDDVAFQKKEFTWGNDSIDRVHLEKLYGSGEWIYSSLNPRILFHLNTEGKVIKEESFRYTSDNEWEKHSSYKEYKWSNGNISKELSYSTSDHQLLSTISYTYDTKNNYNIFWGIVAGAEGLNKNNTIRRIYSSETSGYTDTVNIEYEYNGWDYPIKSIAEYMWHDTITNDEIILEYINK